MGFKTSNESSSIVKNDNCNIYIFFLYIFLAISVVITVSAVYIFNGSKCLVPAHDVGNYGNAHYENESESSFDCGRMAPTIKSWYFKSQYNPGYTCEPFKKVTSVNVQPLHVRGHGCNDSDHCYDLIRTYLNIVEQHSKFGFFVDNDANVYGGRGWFCEFLRGQIWVAVMVNGFEAASQTEKDRILHNFKEGVVPHIEHCSVNVSELQFNYYDEIGF